MIEVLNEAELRALPYGSVVVWRLIADDPTSTVSAIVCSVDGDTWLRCGDVARSTAIVSYPARAVVIDADAPAPAPVAAPESRAAALNAATALGCTLRAKGITFDISELLDIADDFTNWMEGRR